MGMLLELPVKTLRILLIDEVLLQERLHEAVQVLQQAGVNGSVDPDAVDAAAAAAVGVARMGNSNNWRSRSGRSGSRSSSGASDSSCRRPLRLPLPLPLLTPRRPLMLPRTLMPPALTRPPRHECCRRSRCGYRSRCCGRRWRFRCRGRPSGAREEAYQGHVPARAVARWKGIALRCKAACAGAAASLSVL